MAAACVLLLALMIGARALGQEPGARRLAPWLDVPAAWTRKVENGVIAVSPPDLPPGRSLLLLVEPPRRSSQSLADAYEQALRDLGPWRPVGEPVEQRFDSGWAFRLGVGVTTLEGRRYTAQTAVARRGNQRVRFWALADSDDTFNRYKNALAVAIASAQDIATGPAPMAAPARPRPGKLQRGFGEGISGVYAGLERGLSASAGVASGPQQVFNPSSGRYETSNTGTATAPAARIGDYAEVDVFYPDGTYRRRLPIRGLMSDMSWERKQQPILWGTWERKDNKVVVRRGSHTTGYTIEGDDTLVSERGRPWVKIASPSDARLDGVYAREDYRGAGAPRLVLRADGTYEDRGEFLRMIGSAWHLVVPDGDAMFSRWSDAQTRRALGAGSGSYSLDHFSLTLRGRDGRVWQINAYVPPGEALPRARRLVVNGRALVRE